MRENNDPRENRDNKSEDPSDSVNWLDQLASSAGSIWDETDSVAGADLNDNPQQATDDEIPDWLKADLQKDVPVDEDVPNWLVSEIEETGSSLSGNDASDLLEHASDFEAEHGGILPDDDRLALDHSEEPVSEEHFEIMDDGSVGEDESHLPEIIEDGSGTSTGEPPTTKRVEVERIEPDPSDEEGADRMTWIGDLETMPEMELNGDEAHRDSLILDGSEIPKDSSEPLMEKGGVEGQENLYDEVPDDPDEAMAWLEQLAAKQGAPREELPSMFEEGVEIETGEYSTADVSLDEDDEPSIEDLPQDSMPGEVFEEISTENSEQPVTPDIEDTLLYGLSGFTSEDVYDHSGMKPVDDPELAAQDIPEDPDEAMIWIEELSARQSAPTAKLSPRENGMEDDKGGPQLEGEHAVVPEVKEPGVDDFELFGELDEALSWLEELVDLDEGDPAEPVEIIEEQPTPHVVRDILPAVGDASLSDPEFEDQNLIAPEETFSVEDVEVTDDTAEAFAWLDHLAETGSDLPDDLVAPELDDFILTDSVDLGLEASDEEVKDMPTLESQDPVFEPLEDPLPIQANDNEIDMEMAWLDTLGSVRSEEWLAEEEEVPVQKIEPILSSPDAVKSVVTGSLKYVFEVERVDDKPAAEVIDDLGPEEVLSDSQQAQLEMARTALSAGMVEAALEQYESLLEVKTSIPFVISDLEASLEQDGDRLLVQRTLGDAYVQNGQLKKALVVYRQALDTL